MADHPNVDLLRKGYEAFAAGDLAAVDSLFADDIVWHQPGNNPLTGDFEGKEAAFAILGKLLELTGGTYRQEIHDILANDTHGVVMVSASAERPGGASWTGRGVHIWHMSDGKSTEFWIFNEDQAAADAFFN